MTTRTRRKRKTWVSGADAARHIGYDPSWFYKNWSKHPALCDAARKPPGGHRRFDLDAVLAWFEACK